jgi:hypothetical protein
MPVLEYIDTITLNSLSDPIDVNYPRLKSVILPEEYSSMHPSVVCLLKLPSIVHIEVGYSFELLEFLEVIQHAPHIESIEYTQFYCQMALYSKQPLDFYSARSVPLRKLRIKSEETLAGRCTLIFCRLFPQLEQVENLNVGIVEDFLLILDTLHHLKTITCRFRTPAGRNFLKMDINEWLRDKIKRDDVLASMTVCQRDSIVSVWFRKR